MPICINSQRFRATIVSSFEVKEFPFFQAYQNAVRSNRGDLRIALAESAKQLALQPGPRILEHTTRSNKVVDTENKLERSELKPDGLIVTESRKTVEHEEVSLPLVP